MTDIIEAAIQILRDEYERIGKALAVLSPFAEGVNSDPGTVEKIEPPRSPAKAAEPKPQPEVKVKVKRTAAQPAVKEGTKTCSKCGKSAVATAAAAEFPKTGKLCHECKKAYMREWWRKNRRGKGGRVEPAESGKDADGPHVCLLCKTVCSSDERRKRHMELVHGKTDAA